ncbi:unnamed protein product [Microthlaspi erraticum]|uniref:Uncharacterized protein n=1 Tax=Microthlaspi erraticum TaxID=1685480 RepID=A0A6D2HZJ2_9BRAS|nr:unnamed protein product [Microthlaspi erraticum]
MWNGDVSEFRINGGIEKVTDHIRLKCIGSSGSRTGLELGNMGKLDDEAEIQNLSKGEERRKCVVFDMNR